MDMDFADLVERVLVTEFCRTPEEAALLVDDHHRVVLGGMLAGLTPASARATADAILMRASNSWAGLVGARAGENSQQVR